MFSTYSLYSWVDFVSTYGGLFYYIWDHNQHMKMYMKY